MTGTALLFLELFLTFFVIGLFTIGGGYAMLSLIQTEIVVRHGWLTESNFTDIVAISQMTPGPIGINCATYVGYDVVSAASGSPALGVLGSFTTTFALVLPSFIIMLMLVKFYAKFHNDKIFGGVMGWLRPAVIGLIGAAAVILVLNTAWDGVPLFSRPEISVVKENFPDWKSWVLLGTAFICSFKFKVNPILIILAGGVAGLLIY